MCKKTRERKKKNDRTLMSFLCSMMMCCRKDTEKSDDAEDTMVDSPQDEPKDILPGKLGTNEGERTNNVNNQNVDYNKEVVFNESSDSKMYLPSDDLDCRSAESPMIKAINEIFEKNRYRCTPVYETEQDRSESQQVKEEPRPQIPPPLSENDHGQEARSRKLRTGANVFRRTQSIISGATIKRAYEVDDKDVQDSKGGLHGDSVHNKTPLNDQNKEKNFQLAITDLGSQKDKNQEDVSNIETAEIVSMETTDNIENPNRTNNCLNAVVSSVNTRTLESDIDDGLFRYIVKKMIRLTGTDRQRDQESTSKSHPEKGKGDEEQDLYAVCNFLDIYFSTGYMDD